MNFVSPDWRRAEGKVRSTYPLVAAGTKVTGGGLGGCRAKALDQVYGAGTAAKKSANKGQEMRRFESLFQDLETLRRRIQDDPRVVAADGDPESTTARAGEVRAHVLR